MGSLYSEGHGKKNGSSDRVVEPEIIKEGTSQVVNTLASLLARGTTSLPQEDIPELVEKLRADLTPKVFDSVMDSVRAEVGKPDFDPATSPLLEGHSEGTGALLSLIHELLGFGHEATAAIVKGA